MESAIRPDPIPPALTYLQRPAVASIFEIAGRTISFEAKNAELPQLGELLAAYYCSPVSPNAITSPDATIRLQPASFPFDMGGTFDRFEISGGGVGHTDGRTCVFDFKSGRVIVHPGEPHQVDLVMRKQLDLRQYDDLQVVNYAFSTALRRSGLYELHSGAVVEPGTQRGVLFPGVSGSGKSTITLQLIASGWQYLTDDIVYLNDADKVMRAYPLRRAFAVTQATVAASVGRVQEVFANRDWPDGAKKTFIPNDSFPGTFVPNCEPRAIFFPTITNENRSVVEPLAPRETMIKLIKLCPWSSYDPITSRRHLEVLSSLAKQCNGFKLLAGSDLLRDPARVSELVSEHTNSGANSLI
jgi:hypothetical protein